MRSAPVIAAAVMLFGSASACEGEDSEEGLVREASLADDASRLEDAPGAYEWWNFFAVDAKTDLSISMIFNSADPFNCDYRRALFAHRADPDGAPAPSPRDFPLLQLEVTADGEEVFGALRNAPDTTVEFSTTAGSGRIGESTFRGAVEDGVKTYRIHIDAPDTTNESRLEADIVLTAGSPGFTVGGDGLYGAMPGGADHAWQFPLGHPRSAGKIRVTARDGSVLFERDIRGGGYTDHMWGRSLLTDVLASWHFGTVDLSEQGTLVYIWLTPRDEAVPRFGYAFLERPGALATAFPITALTGSERTEGAFGLAYDAAIALSLEGGGTIASRLATDRLGADWPFQVAGPAAIDVAIPGEVDEKGLAGTSEYLWQPGIDDPLYQQMFDLVHDAEWNE